jgi:hypothetical protein
VILPLAIALVSGNALKSELGSFIFSSIGTVFNVVVLSSTKKFYLVRFGDLILDYYFFGLLFGIRIDIGDFS